MRKTPKQNLKAPFLPIPVEGPFDRIAIDALGPLPVTNNGNRYILVISDYLSKWPECFATKNIEAKTVAKILTDEIFSRYGCAKVLLSDKGSNFLSALVKELCKIYRVHKIHTSGYRPQTDGLQFDFVTMFINVR